ncbi:glycosyl hydrolase [Paenarthrobacter nitroguajacolicus]|uniref:glycosyl hydrolase n=1 Tax=Paenarthrobacter nitroguajacolicus TaxID=211146 RepID=UPI00285B18C4|nr:glycosyl hydrolase [Paenarthrobacter nitroguajacolicus]MDR6640384.1 hypothetical protein [Paenarthrobacter nitroguajacolicus]
MSTPPLTRRSYTENSEPAPLLTDPAPLFEAFVTPPDSARPRAWWHWMDGNVNEDGIDADLAWLKGIGAGGVQMFFGSFGAAPLVEEPVKFLSKEWQSAVRRAASQTKLLGMELSVATSAGWSATGGPWVAQEAGMKKLVWSTTVIESAHFPCQLPTPPTASGPFQDVPCAATRHVSADVPDFFQDIAVLAFPFREGHQSLIPASVTCNSTVTGDPNLEDLADGTFWPPVVIEASPRITITADYAEPVVVKSARIGLPAFVGFGGNPLPEAVLEASNDNSTFWPVTRFEGTKSPVRSLSFPAQEARYFRLVITTPPSGSAPVAEGIKPLTFPSTGSGVKVSCFQLFGGSRVSRAEEKAGFAPVPDYYALEAEPADAKGAVPLSEVVDVSDYVDANGTLNWEPAEGRWTVVRLGYSLTGHVNAPAPEEATGLEVDKLDAGHVADYLHTYLGFFQDALGEEPAALAGIDALLSDSIESGPQNWTRNMLSEFQSRRGYSLLPWLPALTGILVEGTQESDDFLWDFRKTISELLAENHYGTIASIAAGLGMDYYAEALEDHRPQLGDDLEMRSHADVPMGAMWCYTPESGPRQTFIADLRGAASVSHVYGKPRTGAESMTAFGQPFRYTPGILKPIVDMEFALGVNLINIHTSPHQPAGVEKPGITLAPYLGQSFSRNETWAHAARPWIDYMARCSHLLQQGTYVADIAYFYGEESPVTGVFGDSPAEVPQGHGFDFINLDGLTNHINVTPAGELLSSGGTRYKVLYLGGTSRRMTLAMLRRVQELLDAGATVIGKRPEGSPSHGDDALAWREAVDRIWNGKRSRLLEGGAFEDISLLPAALKKLGLRPDWSFDAGDGYSLPTIHRTTPVGELYFISNQLERPERVTASFRTRAGSAELWDPYQVVRTALPSRHSEGRTTLDIHLPPLGSAFVLLRPQDARTGSDPASGATPSFLTSMELQGPWEVTFPDRDREAGSVTLNQVAPWAGQGAFTHGDSDIKYFSGTAGYCHDFALPTVSAEETYVIDLGEVRDVAQVWLNEVPLGTAWTSPFQVRASNAVRSGVNRLRIEVTNTWSNRLAGDAAQGNTGRPGSEIFLPDAPLRKSGLVGPVRIHTINHPLGQP